MSQKAENEYTRDNHFSVIQASYAASNKPTTIYIHGGPKKFNFFPIHYIFGTAQNNMKLVVVKALTDLILKSFLIITEKNEEVRLIFRRVIAKKTTSIKTIKSCHYFILNGCIDMVYLNLHNFLGHLVFISMKRLDIILCSVFSVITSHTYI